LSERSSRREKTTPHLRAGGGGGETHLNRYRETEKTEEDGWQDGRERQAPRRL
jgi:hypothetical protein